MDNYIVAAGDWLNGFVRAGCAFHTDWDHAHQDGWYSRAEGKALDACPHMVQSRPADWAWWRLGWYDADAALRQLDLFATFAHATHPRD